MTNFMDRIDFFLCIFFFSWGTTKYCN